MDEQVEKVLQFRRSGQHLRVVELVRNLHRERPLLTAGEWCDVFRSAALSANDLGKPFDARWWADLGYQTAKEAQDDLLIGAAAYLLGTLWVYIGDMTQALEYLGRFVELDSPHRPEWDRYRGPAWFNQGTAHMNRRQYDDAACDFSRAAEAFAAAGNQHRVIETHLQAAWLETLAGRYPLAQQHLDWAMQSLAENPDTDLEVSRICHEAHLVFRLGDITAALQLCEEVLVPGRPGITDRHLATAGWVAGESGLALGLIQEAGQFASLSLDCAVRANWPAMMNWASNLRRRIREAGNQSA